MQKLNVRSVSDFERRFSEDEEDRKSCAELKAQLAKDIAEFLRSGGEIQMLESEDLPSRLQTGAW